MDFTLWIGLGILQIILLVSLILAVLFVYRNSRKKDLVRLENALKGIEANFQEESKKLQARIEQLEDKGNRNTELFKTVLHGFDFIVQGCKKAMSLNEPSNDNVINLNEKHEVFLEKGKEEAPEQVTEKIER